MNKSVLVIFVLLATIMVLGVASSPAIYAKHKHHKSDIEKEDSTASDSNDVPCTFGPNGDQCYADIVRNAATDDQGRLCISGPHHNECPDEAWANDS